VEQVERERKAAMKVKRWKRSVGLKNWLVGCIAIAAITPTTQSQTLQIESIPSVAGEGQTIISRKFNDGIGVASVEHRRSLVAARHSFNPGGRQSAGNRSGSRPHYILPIGRRVDWFSMFRCCLAGENMIKW
jgi:hypothetical protein